MLDDTMAHLPVTRPPGADVQPGPDGLEHVKLWGRLPLGWPGALSAGLTARGVSILNGFARRSMGNWDAELTVRPPAGHLGEVDYLALAVKGSAPSGEVPIVLERFTLERSRHVGAERLLLDVWGIDRVGFLGSLLGRLAGLSLFPEAMAIETRGDTVVDSFTLRAIGGMRPTDTVEKALHAQLLGLLRPEPLAAGTSFGL
jgi:hypothetical protein